MRIYRAPGGRQLRWGSRWMMFSWGRWMGLGAQGDFPCGSDLVIFRSWLLGPFEIRRFTRPLPASPDPEEKEN